MLEVLLDWRGDDVVDEAQLATDVGEFAFDYADMQLKDLKIGVLFHRVAAILREHSIVMPADLTLMFKALISLEGLGRQYDPEFRLIERAKPFLERAMLERYQPAEAVRRGQTTLSDLFGWSRRCRATSRGWSKTRVTAGCGSTSTSSASTASSTASTAQSIA